jgi:sugar lactone lactonase YvrE
LIAGSLSLNFAAPAMASAPSQITLVTDQVSQRGIAFDSNGDLFIANSTAGTITVIASATRTIFGQTVTQNVATTLAAATGLVLPRGIAFDSNGDLFIANSGNNQIIVLPAATGTVFGQSVTANTSAILTPATGLDSPEELAFDTFGNLFIANFNNNQIIVLPAATGTVFGQSVTANTSAELIVASGLGGATGSTGVTFDSHGNLFIANYNANAIDVIPLATGTIFGQSVTANTAATLTAATGLVNPWAVTFDAAGNLFILNNNGGGAGGVVVLPLATGTIFGQSVTANTAATITALSSLLSSPWGIAFDLSGNLYVANSGFNTVTVLAQTSGTIFGQSVTASSAADLVVTSGLSGPRGLGIE